MSLVNNYLKRLGRKPIVSEGKGVGLIPPSLQRIQKKSWKDTLRKNYRGFAGLVLLVSCLGYLCISVISILLYPSVDESVAVEPIQLVVDSVAKEAVETHVTPPQIVKTDVSELAPQAKVNIQLETNSPIAPNEVIVAQNYTVRSSPSQQNEINSAEVDRKTIVSGHERIPLGQSEERGRKSMQPSRGGVVEPLPLADTWQTTHESSTPSNGVQKPPSKIILKKSDSTPDYIYQLGLQAQHNNKYGLAERYYKNVLEDVPKHENALINLSAIYIQEKRMKEAKNLLDQVLTLNPENSKALVNIGMIELQQDKKQSAANYFLQALKYNPIEETALRNMAYLAQLDKRYDEASNYFEQLIRISPEKIDILLAYAGLEETLHNYRSAINLYTKCLDQINMQKNPKRHEELMIRIQILRQYSAEQGY